MDDNGTSQVRLTKTVIWIKTCLSYLKNMFQQWEKDNENRQCICIN